MRKIKSVSEIYSLRNKLPDNQIVVLATGVFDLLHQEHKNFLRAAKNTGDILLVGLETDRRVRYLKGEGRPIQNQHQRLKNLARINFVDYLFLLPESLVTKQGREEFISKLHPTIYAVSRQSPFQAEKNRILKKYQGQLQVVHPHNPAISTTKIIANRKLVT